MDTHILASSIYIVAGGKLDPDKRARIEEMTILLGRARNSFDVEPVLPNLSDDVEQRVQNKSQVIIGRPALTEHLRARWATLKKMSETADIGRLSLGAVDLPSGKDYPCLIFDAEGYRQALWTVTLNSAGLISRLGISTFIPHPRVARFIRALDDMG
jgi:hypothetical protein